MLKRVQVACGKYLWRIWLFGAMPAHGKELASKSNAWSAAAGHDQSAMVTFESSHSRSTSTQSSQWLSDWGDGVDRQSTFGSGLLICR